ncbi:MAG TPA: phenylalanine--tRNA ligase subunit beta, partial [Nitrospirales bacterium]|nr:phenylalanine--tRNA ligase subunit beta [Nitrospirales bacterium]
MPTITINRADFAALVGRPGKPVSAEELSIWLPLVKGELKDDEAEQEWRIELQDSNRPDLWSCEGVARQIRIGLDGKPASYSFFATKKQAPRRIVVSPGMEEVRPYVAACTASRYEMTAEGLAQFIQTQEKLADIYGRKRATVSIGIYRLAPIVFPVAYTLVKPDEGRFTPLGFDQKLSPREILTVHPKGMEYAGILAGHERVPLLVDAEGQILSFPPIINSRELGEFRPGDRELFVEVTGTDLSMVILTLNILAVNLADRGAVVEPLDIQYPYDTPRGATVQTPQDIGTTHTVSLTAVEGALGEPLRPAEIESALRRYGYEVTQGKGALQVRLPPYRNDVMHPVDVVEDVAISRGYHTFAPVMPTLFTIGGLSRTEQMSDRMRDLLVGFGFQEVMSNIMTSRADVIERMRLAETDWGRVVEVDNVMSQSYACLRQWIVPSLLRVEAASGRAFYPHRIFEAGEVAVPDGGDPQGSRTVMM